jgi:hypothetical protein
VHDAGQVDEAGQARRSATTAVMAASTASGPSAVGWRRSATISPFSVAATASSFVPPMSTPAVREGEST